MHFGGVSDARPPMSARVCDLRKRRAPFTATTAQLPEHAKAQCSTARRDAPIDDDALSVGGFLDGDQSEALREPDGGARLGSADVGALGDPCNR